MERKEQEIWTERGDGRPVKRSNAENPGDDKRHVLTVDGRRSIEITGVSDVLRFDDAIAELLTVEGILIVEGKELHLSVFDTARGVVHFDGEVCLLEYCAADAAEKSEKKHGRFGFRR